MNKLLPLLLCLVLTPVSLASADLKVAIVDLAKAFDSYYKTQDASTHMKQKADAFQKDMQDLVSQYQHMGDEAQALKKAADDPTLSAAARDDKNKALQAKVQELRNMEAKVQEMKTERQREFDDESMRRRKEIVEEITKTINDYAGPQGYDLVIDKSPNSAGNGVPVVLFASSKLVDITPDIIKQLNASRPATSAPAAPAGSGTTPAPAH